MTSTSNPPGSDQGGLNAAPGCHPGPHSTRAALFWLRLWHGSPPGTWLLSIALATAGVMLAPMIYVVVRGVQGSADTWVRLLDGRLALLLRNSLSLAAVVAAVAVLVGISLAWLAERTDLPGRRVWQWLLALPLAVPPYVGAMAYIILLGPRGWLNDLAGRPVVHLYGFWGTALILGAFTYPYVYLIATALLKRMSRDYEELALTSGISRGALFLRVTLPFLRPAVGAGGLLAGVYALSDFGAVAILRYTTFTSAIYYQMGSFDLSAAAALSLVLMVLTVGLVALEFKSRQRLSVQQTQGTYAAPLVVKLGRWLPAALALVVLVAFLAAGLPLGVLVAWTCSQAIGLSLDSQFARWASNSLLTSGLAASACMGLALPVAYLAMRHPSVVSRVSERVAYSGYALPGVIVGLGLVFLFNRYLPTFYGTALPVIVAYVVRFLPQCLRSGEAAISLVPRALEEAARTLGLSAWRTLGSVIWPLVRPGLLAGGLLVFVSALKELPATLLLRPPGMDTLAVRVWVEAGEGYYRTAALPALLIVAMSVVPLRWMLAETLGRRH